MANEYRKSSRQTSLDGVANPPSLPATDLTGRAPVDPYSAEDPYLTTAAALGPPLEEVYPGQPVGRWTRADWAATSTMGGPSSEVDPGAVLPGPAVEPAPAEVPGTARSRSFARVGVWGLPVAAAALTVGALWGWPRPDDPPNASPTSWLVVTTLGLVLALLGGVCLALLLAPGRSRAWMLAGVVSALLGTVLLAPPMGVIGLVRPSAERLGTTAQAFQADPNIGPVLQWLAVFGLILFGAGWTVVACAVLASRVLSRTDGVLILGAIALALAATFTPASPLLIVATLATLAAGLGLAWTVTRTDDTTC